MKRILILLIALITTASSACAEGTVTTGSVEDRGFVLDNVLHDEARGDIHFSIYVPESYDGFRPVPLYVALPGWEGLYFQGVGADLKWETMPFAAREYDPDMIVASAQLNDWGMTSAQDAVALTEYLMSAYSIDPNRVYLSGYSGGGETGSLVMELRPELYAAYLMMASQWDGDLESLAKARTPVYMIIGEDDSYYGSESLKSAYARLHTLYEEKGLSYSEIDDILVLNVKDADWFAQRGISDQHGGGMAFPEEPGLLEWFFSKTKKGWYEMKKIIAVLFLCLLLVPAALAENAIIVYFSATGTTEQIANGIAAQTGADLFAIEPVVPYTDDDLNWRDPDSRVCVEHEAGEAPVELVSVEVPSWADYDTVYIGYPIWWQDASWVMDGFVTANDFTGKTVIPFCTSQASGYGESGERLAAKAGTGNWIVGGNFFGEATDEEITEWLNGLEK